MEFKEILRILLGTGIWGAIAGSSLLVLQITIDIVRKVDTTNRPIWPYMCAGMVIGLVMVLRTL